jgi:hypothetical protein
MLRLIALMLGRLRMSVDDAIAAYAKLAKEVFSDIKPKGHEGRFKTSKLENAIKQIVGARSASNDPRGTHERQSEQRLQNVCSPALIRTMRMRKKA